MNRYIQIGKIELWISSSFAFEKLTCAAGCKMYHFGWVGFTILAGDCIND